MVDSRPYEQVRRRHQSQILNHGYYTRSLLHILNWTHTSLPYVVFAATFAPPSVPILKLSVPNYAAWIFRTGADR